VFVHRIVNGNIRLPTQSTKNVHWLVGKSTTPMNHISYQVSVFSLLRSAAAALVGITLPYLACTAYRVLRALSEKLERQEGPTCIAHRLRFHLAELDGFQVRRTPASDKMWYRELTDRQTNTRRSMSELSTSQSYL